MHMCVPSLPCAQMRPRVRCARRGVHEIAREGGGGIGDGTLSGPTVSTHACAQAAGPRARAIGWAV